MMPEVEERPRFVMAGIGVIIDGLIRQRRLSTFKAEIAA